MKPFPTTLSILEKKDKGIDMLLNVHAMGNYQIKFTLTEPETSSGKFEIKGVGDHILYGRFQVYISDEQVYAALYSDQKVKVLDEPLEKFLELLKLMLPAGS